MIGYEIFMSPRTLVTGKDLILEKRMMVANMAERLVKYETIAPNSSGENLLNMYNQFQQSLTQPSGTSGVHHVYDSLITIFTPMAQQYKYAGIESVRLVMPPAPSSIYSWLDMTGTPLIPSDYPSAFANSTCPSAKPNAADIQTMIDAAATATP